MEIDFNALKSYQDPRLRDYQVENKNKIYDLWTKHRSIMLQMPTGTGKTRLFISIANDAYKWGLENNYKVRILFLAHRKELIKQISDTLYDKYGLNYGVIASKHDEEDKYPFQVGSVPSLNRRLHKWENFQFDIVIVDEAHHIKATSYLNIINQYPEAKILGVTATPYRLSGAGFKLEFEQLILSENVAKFIEDGWLCHYE